MAISLSSPSAFTQSPLTTFYFAAGVVCIIRGSKQVGIVHLLRNCYLQRTSSSSSRLVSLAAFQYYSGDGLLFPTTKEMRCFFSGAL